MKHEHRTPAMDHSATKPDHYVTLLWMIGLSFVAMYILMSSMVNAYADVYHNVNQFYMAGLMVAPMVTIELLVMGAMYGNKRLNTALMAISVLAAVVFSSASAARARSLMSSS